MATNDTLNANFFPESCSSTINFAKFGRYYVNIKDIKVVIESLNRRGH